MFSARKRPLFRTVGGRLIQGTFTRSSPAWLDGVEYATNVPRFPSINGTRGVLVEEGTTPIQTFTNDLTNAVYTKSNLTTSLVTVDGEQATRLIENTTPGVGHTLDATAPTAGQPTTVSCEAKMNGRRWVAISPSGGSVYFDLQAGALGTQSSATGTITALADGWYRLTATVASASGGVPVLYLASADGVTSYTGDGASGVYVRRWQTEHKAYATSYMPRPDAAAVTRAPETLTVPTAGLLTPSAGSVTFDYTQRVALGATRVLWHCEIDANNYWSLLVHSTGRPYFEIKSGGVSYSTYSASNAIPAAGSRVRVTLRFNGATATHFTNGTKSAAGDVAYTQPVGTFPALMWLGSGVSEASPSNPVIFGLHTHTRALSDSEGVAASLGSVVADFTAYFNFQTGYVRGFTPGSNPIYSPNLFTPLT